jgi:hypothetical protein
LDPGCEFSLPKAEPEREEVTAAEFTVEDWD